MPAEPSPSMGRVRIWYPRVTSTMDVAMALGSGGAPHGTLVLADEQTAGRGRQGRRWDAPAGSSFLGSWLLRAPAGTDVAALSPAVAAAVVRTVEGLAPEAPVTFKWPNDVLVDEQKVAGILLTARAAADGSMIVIAGTGINIFRASVPPGIAATCLADWARVSIADVRERLAVELDFTWAAARAEEGLPDCERELLEARMAFRDEPVEVTLPDGAITGIAAGLATDGGLRLRSLDGLSERVLRVGEVARGPRVATEAGRESAVYLPEHDCC